MSVDPSYGAHEAQRRAAEAEATQTEFGWLIESGSGSSPSYWDGRGIATFILDSNDAVRFSRRADAERVLGWIVRPIGVEVRIVQHGWYAR